MIPTTIRREHVLRAAEWIDRHGDEGRPSRRYLVSINGKPYPPKLVISKAYIYTHGSEWPSDAFTGGEETNSFLRTLGFKIVGGASILQRRGDKERPGTCHIPAREEAHQPASTPLERVSQIAGSMNANVTKVESDVGGEGADSFLVLRIQRDGPRDVFVANGLTNGDEVLYLWVSMDFDPPISGYVGDRPREDYSEFMGKLMRGRTWFDLDLESSRLKGVDLHQRVTVTPGDESLRKAVLAAMTEILQTEDSVKSATGGARHIPKRTATGTRPGPMDNMYA